MLSVGSWILFFLPIVLFGAIYAWRWKLDQRRERIPLSAPLLRPAGESLRLKIIELDEKLAVSLFIAVVWPIAYGLLLCLKFPLNHWTADATVVLIGTGGFAFGVVGSFRAAAKLRQHRLGYHGERACGEELNQLMRDGCHVFHDIPMQPYGNIDHVVVAPTGIYAVETKTRRKRKMPDEREDHVVTYDGTCLRFPCGIDTSALEQTARQAKQLQMLLSSAVGEPINVHPILALPGWFVRRTSAQGIPVVNPKSTRHIVLDRKKPCLDPKLLKRVVHQLEQRCRDVTL